MNDAHRRGPYMMMGPFGGWPEDPNIAALEDLRRIQQYSDRNEVIRLIKVIGEQPYQQIERLLDTLIAQLPGKMAKQKWLLDAVLEHIPNTHGENSDFNNVYPIPRNYILDLPNSLRTKEVILALIGRVQMDDEMINRSLFNDREFILEMAKQGQLDFEWWPIRQYLKDREIVLATIRGSISQLRYWNINSDLITDKEIAIELIKAVNAQHSQIPIQMGAAIYSSAGPSARQIVQIIPEQIRYDKDVIKTIIQEMPDRVWEVLSAPYFVSNRALYGMLNTMRTQSRGYMSIRYHWHVHDVDMIKRMIKYDMKRHHEDLLQLNNLYTNEFCWECNQVRGMAIEQLKQEKNNE